MSRVLWISTSLQTRGGISSYVRTMAGTALWSDWDVEHLATHQDGSRATKIVVFLRAWLVLVARLALRRPTIIHLHMSSNGSFVRKALLFWTAAPLGIPQVVHVHGSEFDRFHDVSRTPVRALIRRTLTHADAVIALGERWAERLAVIAPEARVVVLPNAVVLGDPAHPAGEPVEVVFLGEIGERKGAFVLLDAWAKAMSGRPLGSARLTLAGDRAVDAARDRVDRLGIADSCRIHGWLSPTDTQALLGRSDVLVLPSRSEGQPMAVLEAMAAGLCVISTPVGGIPEMIDDGDSGLLVPPDDPAALAGALTRVLDDAAARARLGAAARARVLERFDARVIARHIDALYASISEGEQA